MVKKCAYFMCVNKVNCPDENCPGCGGEAYQKCGCGICVNQSVEGSDGNVEVCLVALVLREADMEEKGSAVRKDLGRKYAHHQMALEGRGIIINPAEGQIYRLAVAPDGWCRVAQNDFDITCDTVLGPAKQTWDFKTPGEAISFFEKMKGVRGMVWREDDRVFYKKEC